MSRSECLSAIAESWLDMAPSGVRQGAPPRDQDDTRFVHESFSEQAARRPGAPAIIAGRVTVTYGKLEESANRLAHHLIESGVSAETVIGSCLDRGPDMIRAMLAIMKAGAAYLPLDPSLPAERLRRICSQVRAAAVITGGTGGCPVQAPPPLRLDEIAAGLARRPATAPAVRPHPGNACYVIYTSGSTGDPKPVMVSYASLAGVIGEVAGEYQVSEDDRVAQFASTAFDTSLEQVFVALTRGASLVLPPPGTMAPSDLLRCVERRRITVIDLTPAYWHQVLALAGPADERLRSVRLMITGGERADPADCRAALLAAPWARLLNAYGLTETTITTTLFDVGAGAAGPPAAPLPAAVPVGRPVGRARVMVMDQELAEMPAGTTGEICIGGHGVARGYLGRPALTAESFLPDPGGAPGDRMYRTGDFGRWGADGTLEVTGRADRQVKVRGFRVDPAEIESALTEHPEVATALVVAVRHAPGDTRLTAYYTPARAPGDGPRARHPSAASLRRHLLGLLPGYMIPATFIPRGDLPSDRERGLPERTERRAAGRQDRYTPTEAGLSDLWSRLLRVPSVGLDDDFFAIGGNSLLAAEMLTHARARFGISADWVRPLTRCLLRDPTLRGFAAAVRDARAGVLSASGEQQAVDFARETALGIRVRRDALAARPRPRWRDPGEILLTGATGFLGAHLLSELLASTTARVWCLVRARDAADAMRRMAGAAARYELAAPPAGRVVPLPGDLSAPRLGLSEAAFRDLARGTDVIYHAGALVNFIYPYQELRAANVAGTREVIRLAGLYRGVPVHYMSSTAVLAGLGVAGVRSVTEQTPLAFPERLRVGYVETKYVAEELLRGAGQAGLPVAVYRPLDIVGSLGAGLWSTSAEMCALIRFMTDTGLAPDIDLPLDFVPVDACAAAVRHISVTQAATGRAYHLSSPEPAPFGALVERLRDRGYQISSLPYADWAGELARHAADDPSHPMTAFLPLFSDRDQDTGRTVAEMYFGDAFPRYGRSGTERALRGSGIAFPPVRGRLLDRNIDRLIETGYLSPPSVSRLPAHAD